MRPLEAEREVKAILEQLDSEMLLSRFREYEKAGYPASSMSDGRGSAETPCPVAVTPPDPDWLPRKEGEPLRGDTGRVLGAADPTDRQIRADRLLYEQSLRHMATAARTAIRISNAYLIAPSTDSEKTAKLAAPKGSGPCGNVWCDHVCEGRDNDRLRKAPKRSGDDPAKAEVARCQPCDQHWRRHGVERDPRIREVNVKKPGPESDKIAARNFVRAHPEATPFVASCARKLKADAGWLPSADQTKLLLDLAQRVTSNQSAGDAA